MQERIKKIAELAKQPLTDDKDTRRVEIIMLKFNEAPEIINESVQRIIHNTNHPFKLTLFDNRLNNANTSRIWNKLIKESTCEYVLIIDSDAFVPECEPCWLTRMMESIDETGIVVPVGDNVGGAHQKRNGQEKYGETLHNKGVWSGYCFLVKKDVFKKYGLFSEQYYAYGQDSEFAHRVRGIGAIQRNDVFVKHMSGYSFKKADSEGSFDREADKEYARLLFRKHTNG